MALKTDVNVTTINKEANGEINEELVKLIRVVENITGLSTLQAMIILQHKITRATQNLLEITQNEIAQNN